ncbi:MAG TPA: methyltransferase domain-containing protein [Rhizomicrobium sp.]|jgi:predicted TPR repeat methyltransferase|nr:methyltransferase domain-containing protein [Rhizomicrobium sp.]
MLSSLTTASARFLSDEDPVAAAEALIAEGRASEAAALLGKFLSANRGGLLMRLTMQKALAASGDKAGALAMARETALANANIALAALALGDALLAADQLPTAIGEFQRALRLDPQLERARAQLGAAWLAAGEAQKALEAWDTIENIASLEALAPAIADAEKSLARPRSDPRYVRHLFDQFSASYDSRMMTELLYSAPSILRQLAELLGLDRRGPQAILDLGCGTGLMGLAVRDWVDRLDGVDLSPAMIEKARPRAIYDELFVSDVGDWLARQERHYDLVFAADTLVYLGDLAPLFEVVARCLARDGQFLFTVEKSSGPAFELGPKRRWRHSETYLRELAEGAGLNVAGLIACEPRTEAGSPVEGLAAAFAQCGDSA